MRLACSIFFCLVLVGVAFSETKTWTGGGGTTNWTDADNWSGGTAPTASSDVVIPDGFNGLSASVINQSFTIASLTVGQGGLSGAKLAFVARVAGDGGSYLFVKGNLTVKANSCFSDTNALYLYSPDTVEIDGNLLQNDGVIGNNNGMYEFLLFIKSVGNFSISGAGNGTYCAIYVNIAKPYGVISSSTVSINDLWAGAGMGSLYFVIPGTWQQTANSLWVPQLDLLTNCALEITNSGSFLDGSYNAGAGKLTIDGGNLTVNTTGSMILFSNNQIYSTSPPSYSSITVNNGVFDLENGFVGAHGIDCSGGTVKINNGVVQLSDTVAPHLKVTSQGTLKFNGGILNLYNTYVNPGSPYQNIDTNIVLLGSIDLNGSTIHIGNGDTSGYNGLLGVNCSYQFCNPAAHFYNLTIQTGGATGSGVNLLGQVRVDNALSLASGTVNTLSDTLVLGPSAAVSQSTGYVNGRFKRFASSTADSLFFPIGTNNGYSPVTFYLPANSVSANSFMNVRVLQSVSGNVQNQTNILKRTWQVRSSGLTFQTCGARFTYLPQDFPTELPEVGNNNESGLRVAQNNGTGIFAFPAVDSRQTGRPDTADGGSIVVSNILALGSPYTEFLIGKDTTVFSPAVPAAAPVLVYPSANAVGIPLSASLIWGRVYGASTYEVNISNNQTFSTSIIDSSNIRDSSFAISSLLKGTMYYWRVKAKNSSGSSNWSAVRSFTTIAALVDSIHCLAPASHATVSADSILLVWNKGNAGVDRYCVQIAVDSLMSSPITDSTVTDTSKIIRSLQDGQTYWWRVSAHNEAGWGSFGLPISFSVNFITNAVAKTFVYVAPRFNLTTGMLSYTLPCKSYVNLKLYSVQGRLVSVLVNREQSAGSYQVKTDLMSKGSGLYIFKFNAAKYSVIRSIIINK
jgi:hypothetical protein